MLCQSYSRCYNVFHCQNWQYCCLVVHKTYSLAKSNLFHLCIYYVNSFSDKQILFQRFNYCKRPIWNVSLFCISCKLHLRQILLLEKRGHCVPPLLLTHLSKKTFKHASWAIVIPGSPPPLNSPLWATMTLLQCVLFFLLRSLVFQSLFSSLSSCFFYILIPYIFSIQIFNKHFFKYYL